MSDRGRPKKKRGDIPAADAQHDRARQRQLAKLVLQAREKRGWSQRDLAAYARCSPETIAGLERGDVDPRFSTLGRVAQALEVPLVELLGEEEI